MHLKDTERPLEEVEDRAFSPDGVIPDHSMRLLIEAAQLASGQPTSVTPEQLADFSYVRRVYAQMSR